MAQIEEERIDAGRGSESIADLAEQIRRFHERTERHEQIIRQMQERITELQGDQVQALLKPALVRFAGLHAQASDAEAEAIERGEHAARDLAFFRTAIEEALALIDLDSVAAAVGIPFDPARHHATGVVATPARELDQTVQRVIRQGFAYTDATRTAIPAQVVIFRYEAADDEAQIVEPTATEVAIDEASPAVQDETADALQTPASGTSEGEEQ